MSVDKSNSKKGIWLPIYIRGIILWVVLNWTIFLVIDGILTSSHKVKEIYIYKYLFLSVMCYLFSLNLGFCKKIFYLKELYSDEQLSYLLTRSSLWCGVFFFYMIDHYLN